MILYAIYVLTEDGRTILSENLQPVEGVADDVLLGGVSNCCLINRQIWTFRDK